jgi:hypothetical protein
MVEPDCEVELETTTAMNAGNGPGGGGVLLPVSVIQLVPQDAEAGVSSKPLNDAGAGPPLSVFSFDHWAPQKVTSVPIAAFPSPITKLPPGVTANTVTWQVATAVDRRRHESSW